MENCLVSPLNPRSLDLARICHQACLMEATARKPGNVHPEARFEDLCYDDFVKSATWASPHLARSGTDGIGRSVRDAVRVTREQVGTNTNLGISLLIAPLAAVPLDKSLEAGIADVLQSLSSEDATLVYEAISLAQPGGMGKVPAGDIADSPPPDLLWAMEQAAERDWIARQYVTGFRDLLRISVPILSKWCLAANWETRVVHLHLQLMSLWPDTLIARKCGQSTALESAQRAKRVLKSDWTQRSNKQGELREFDDWLRADGHRRNPGTTADAVAATLFAAIREGRASFPDWVWPA